MHFTFNGRHSYDFGITVAKQPNWATPDIRAEKIEIAGVNGVEIETHGFMPYIINMDIIVDGQHNIDDIREWLQGKGLFSRSEAPDQYLRVEMQSAPSFRYVVDDLYTAPLTIYVLQPEYILDEPKPEIIKPDPMNPTYYEVYNHGNFPSKPTFSFRFAGLTNEGTSFIFKVNGNPVLIEITKRTFEAVVDFKEVTVKNGRGVVVGTVSTSGYGMPRLKVGKNAIIVQDNPWLRNRNVMYLKDEKQVLEKTTYETKDQVLSVTTDGDELLSTTFMLTTMNGSMFNGRPRTLLVEATGSITGAIFLMMQYENNRVSSEPIKIGKEVTYIAPSESLKGLYVGTRDGFNSTDLKIKVSLETSYNPDIKYSLPWEADPSQDKVDSGITIQQFKVQHTGAWA